MTDLHLVPSDVPPEVRRRIRAHERQVKREEKQAASARQAWRRSVEENLVKGLRMSLKELWETTDLEVRLMAGHLATVAVHTVIPDMEQLEATTEAAIAEVQKPQLLGPDGLPVG